LAGGEALVAVNKQLKVSVITVCYNAEKLIELTIRSVLSQIYPEVEFIVIDGGSQDGTLSIVNTYKDKISKIISEQDNGIYDAMNKGIRYATGDILYFLNSDDYFCDENVVGDAVQEFEKVDRIGIIYGKLNFVNIPPQLAVYFQNYRFQFRSKWHLLIQSNPQQCFFVRKSVFEQIGVFDVHCRICADYDWFLRCWNQRVGIRFTDRFIAVYNCQGVSFTGRYGGIMERIRVVYRNASFIEFIYYLIVATIRKLKDLLKDFLVVLKVH